MKKLLPALKKHKVKGFLSFIALVLIVYVLVVFGLNSTVHKLKTENNVTVSSTLISDTDFLNTVKFGTVDDVEDMLDLGANPKAVDENGRNAAIIAAIFRRDPEIVKVLKNNGVDINQEDTNGYTALMFTYLSGNSQEFITELIKNNANVNAATVTGSSVLMIALGLTNDINVIKPLIDKGANLNYKNGHNVTPLMVALKSTNNPDIINLLLKKGANPKAKDDLGISAYEILQTNDSLKNNQQLINKLQ